MGNSNSQKSGLSAIFNSLHKARVIHQCFLRASIAAEVDVTHTDSQSYDRHYKVTI